MIASNASPGRGQQEVAGLAYHTKSRRAAGLDRASSEEEASSSGEYEKEESGEADAEAKTSDGDGLTGGGMLRADMSPKPVYEQLKQLIHEEWKTRAPATTDATGQFSFRGFFGNYRIVIEMPGDKI